MPFRKQFVNNSVEFAVAFGGVLASALSISAEWPGLESLWTKPRGFAKRSNPGHTTLGNGSLAGASGFNLRLDNPNCSPKLRDY